MKKLLLTGLFTLMFPLLSLAGDITLRWDANTESDLAGYKVYWGQVSRSTVVSPHSLDFTYEKIKDVGNVTTHTIVNLTEGYTFYASVTAYDTSNNESDYSNEVHKIIDTIAPGIPKSLTIQPKKITITIE